MKTILLLSGGIDSTILLYDLLAQGWSVHALLFNYGQQHGAKELSLARFHCERLNGQNQSEFLGFTEITLPTISGSSLTDGAGTKIVPNRNAIFLSVAISMASTASISHVAIGCNEDDACDFPDCRPTFINAMNIASDAAKTDVKIMAPYLNLSKREIVAIGRRLQVPLEATWSCYRGGNTPCGQCDACLKRAEALA